MALAALAAFLTVRARGFGDVLIGVLAVEGAITRSLRDRHKRRLTRRHDLRAIDDERGIGHVSPAVDLVLRGRRIVCAVAAAGVADVLRSVAVETGGQAVLRRIVKTPPFRSQLVLKLLADGYSASAASAAGVPGTRFSPRIAAAPTTVPRKLRRVLRRPCIVISFRRVPSPGNSAGVSLTTPERIGRRRATPARILGLSWVTSCAPCHACCSCRACRVCSSCSWACSCPPRGPLRPAPPPLAPRTPG